LRKHGRTGIPVSGSHRCFWKDVDMATQPLDRTPAEKANAERRFYGRMAIAIFVVIFIGFAPSFYLLQIVSFPRPNPPLTAMTMTHGLVFTAWLAIFYAQTRLIAAGRRDIHRKLGVIGFGLAVTMVPIMYLTAMHAIPRGMSPQFIDAVGWAAVPLLAIPPIALMLVMGWRHRMTAQTHKRFMLLATLMMLEPGLGRWPIFPPNLAGHVASGIASLAFVIPLILWDRKTIGRLHWATKLGLAAMAFGYFARYLVWHSATWHNLVAVLPS
jgi:hypothetical protein